MTEQKRSSKARPSPAGVPNQNPCYNVASRKRRRFLSRWIRVLTTPAGRLKIHRELRRRIRNSGPLGKRKLSYVKRFKLTGDFVPLSANP